MSLRRTDHSSRGVLPTVVFHCVWPREWEGHGPRWAAAPQEINNNIPTHTHTHTHTHIYIYIYIYVYRYIHSRHLIPTGLEPILTHVVCIEHSVCPDKEWPSCITLCIIFLNFQQHPSLILLAVATFLNKYFFIQFIFRKHFCKKQAAATSFSLPPVTSQPLCSPLLVRLKSKPTLFQTPTYPLSPLVIR